MNRNLYEAPDVFASLIDAWLGKAPMPRRPRWISTTDWLRLKVVTQSMVLHK